MNIFQTIKPSLFKLGIGLNQRPFNKNQIKFTLLASLFITLLYIYLFHGDKTYKQYMDAIFMSTEGTFIFIAFLSSIFQMTNISLYIDVVEKTVEKRKFNTIYRLDPGTPLI